VYITTAKTNRNMSVDDRTQNTQKKGQPTDPPPSALQNKWKTMGVENWHKSVYELNESGEDSYFSDLVVDTAQFIKKHAKKILARQQPSTINNDGRAGGGNEYEDGTDRRKVIAIEVGTGTGGVCFPLVENEDDEVIEVEEGELRSERKNSNSPKGLSSSSMLFEKVVGVDINENFIDFAEKLQEEKVRKVDFIVGDCQNLKSILDEKVPELANEDNNIVPIVFSANNTHGILPSAVEHKINIEMAKVAKQHPDGLIIISLWNGNKFGDAVQHFYGKNPQLCGGLDDETQFNWENCEMTTSSGYQTKWSTPEEALRKVEENGWELIELLETGPGVLVAAHPLKRSDSNSVQVPVSRPSSRLQQVPSAKSVENTMINYECDDGSEKGYYYDSNDAFTFYFELWGGENIHVGLYPFYNEDASIEDVLKASDKSLDELLDFVSPVLKNNEKARCIDMGSCYGGCARAILDRFPNVGEILCVDLSKKENDVNRQRTKERSLEHVIKCPKELSFTDTEAEECAYDCVVSQDSFLHAGKDRHKVMEEASRVLKPGGLLVFTDIMQTDTVDPSVLAPVYKRLSLEDMGSPQKYIQWGASYGLKFTGYVDHSEQLGNHYGSVRQILKRIKEKGTFKGKVSDAYIDNMLEGLKHWVLHSNAGNICWGYLQFEKL